VGISLRKAGGSVQIFLMSSDENKYFNQCLDLATGALPSTTTPTKTAIEFLRTEMSLYGLSTSPRLEPTELPTSKVPLSLRIPEPWEGLSAFSLPAPILKSCGVPLPSPQLTVPRKTPGTPELRLGSSSMEICLQDQDKELVQILQLLASASSKVQALLPSRKRIRPTSLGTTPDLGRCNLKSSPFANGKPEFGGITAPQEQGRAMLRDYNLRKRTGRTPPTPGGMDMTPEQSP